MSSSRRGPSSGRRSARPSIAAAAPSSSSAAGRSDEMSARSPAISWRTCSIASSSAASTSARRSARRAARSARESPARPWSVSSCSSRAHRRRSCSAASRLRRSRSAATVRAVPTAVAALAARPRTRSSSAAEKRGSVPRRPYAASTPRISPRKESGATIAASTSWPISLAQSLSRASAPDTRCERPARVTSPETAAVERHAEPRRPRRDPSRGGRGHELVALAQPEDDRLRVDERPRPLDHEVQDAVDVGLGADRAGDRRRHVQAAHRPLELVAPPRRRRVEAGVLHGDGRPRGEHDHRLLVVLAEVLAVLLLGQVQVAERLAAHEDGYAEERAHGRMPGRQPVGPGVLADVVQAQGARLGDQQPEDAAATGQLADGLPGRVVHALGDEALELLPMLVEHTEGRVRLAGARHPPGDVEQLEGLRVLVVNVGSSTVKVSLVGPGGAVIAAVEPAVVVPAAGLAAAAAGLGAADAAGHRIVHGGPRPAQAARIDAEVRRELEALTPLAPLHQPAALAALDALGEALPELPAYACFDTGFHSTLSAAASTYAVPRAWREDLGLRRYGFHGLSHADAARVAAGLLDRPLDELRLVTAHLGAVASLAALHVLSSVDTTMGFT